MKKFLVLTLIVAMLFGVVACSNTPSNESATNESTTGESAGTGTGEETATASGLKKLNKEEIKVGFIYGSSIGDEGYTYAHNLGRLALEEMGIKTMYLENIPETADCEKAARDLIAQGCNVIYATSFGHGEWIANVAQEHPDVYFNHATGYITLNNMATYMGRMYEAEYLAGIAAGMKTKTNKIGFVTTFPIPEVIRQVNSYTLGVRSVNPTATVEVKWTSSWFDPVAEKSAATELINTGCDVIAAYCDTMNPQMAAAERGLFATGCSSPGKKVIPNAYLTAPLFDWAAFYTADIQRIIDGTWTGESRWLGMKDGVVAIDEITENCAEGTKEAVEKAKAAIIDGSLFVFTGEIKDNNGNVRVAEGQKLTDEEMLAMDWFVEGVIGSVN